MRVESGYSSTIYYNNGQLYNGKPASIDGYDEVESIQISDDGRKVSDWSKQFGICFRQGYSDNVLDADVSTREAVKAMGASEGTNRFLKGDTFEYASNMYEKIKAEIDSAFSDSPEQKKLYMMALSSALDRYLQNEMYSYTVFTESRKEYESMLEKGANYADGQETLPKNPLSSHKDFNAVEFGNNLTKMAREFAQAFISGGQKGGYNGGWDNVMKLLGSQETTSINNISFTDFSIITKGMSSYNDEVSDDAGAYWKGKYSDIAKNNKLSTYIQSVFTTG